MLPRVPDPLKVSKLRFGARNTLAEGYIALVRDPNLGVQTHPQRRKDDSPLWKLDVGLGLRRLELLYNAIARLNLSWDDPTPKTLHPELQTINSKP